MGLRSAIGRRTRRSDCDECRFADLASIDTLSSRKGYRVLSIARLGTQVTDVFISYAREMVLPARTIAEVLQSSGLSVWIDDQLPALRDFPTVIEERLRAAKAVLVLWSA